MEVLVLADGADGGARRLIAALERSGCQVSVTARPTEAVHLVRARRVDALVFDAGLAGPDFLGRLRQREPAQTIVAWTASAASPTVADLLDAGADEALHSGMAERELVARVGAAVRRAGGRPAAAVELGPLRIDPVSGEVSWDSREIQMTRREREVLQALAESAGRTVRREALYQRVWGYAMARGDRSVQVNVKRLRDKLAAAGVGVDIRTQPGVGYRLDLRDRDG